MKLNLAECQRKTFTAPIDHSFRLNEEINDYIERMAKIGMRFKGKEIANESKGGIDWVVVKVNFRK